MPKPPSVIKKVPKRGTPTGWKLWQWLSDKPADKRAFRKRLEDLRAQYARAKKAKPAPKKAVILPFPKIGAKAKKTKVVAGTKRKAA